MHVVTIAINCKQSKLSGLFNGTDFLCNIYMYMYIYNYNYFRPTVRCAVNVFNVMYGSNANINTQCTNVTGSKGISTWQYALE